MDFKLTDSKSLLKAVQKDFAGSVEDKAMGVSGMATGSNAGSIKDMTKGKLRRMYEIGQKRIRGEVEEARKKIRAMDVSAEKKRELDRGLGKRGLKVDREFKSLLGFKK